MPIGVLCNVLAVVIGGALGAVLGGRLGEDFKDKLNMIFGVCSMSMGVASIVLMENMPAVVFSVVIGTAVGLWLHLGDRITAGAAAAQKGLARLAPSLASGSGDSAALVTVTVLFCASGTGIYGAIVSGMTGDHSILIAKSVLDLFTALIFACDLGIVVSAVAAPQCIVFLALFFCAGIIFPLTTPAMVNDFKACGGFIMVATGFRIMKVKQFPVADMIPAMVLVMPVSKLWTDWAYPLIAGLSAGR